jgi:hypothetical protein
MKIILRSENISDVLLELEDGSQVRYSDLEADSKIRAQAYDLITTDQVVNAAGQKTEVCACGHHKDQHTATGCNMPLDRMDWMKGFCECKEYRYDEAGELAYLRSRQAELLQLIGEIDDCFSSCDMCLGEGGHHEGPYYVECPTCLGNRYKVTDYRALYLLQTEICAILQRREYHPDYHPEDNDD